MKIIAPEHSTYKTLVADITHRCNMECSNCYIPNRLIPDMDHQKLYDCISKLPQKTEIRLIGAEPTLHPRLIDMISTIKSMGHRPTVTTNGLRLRSKTYVEKLEKAGLRSLGISMNGALNDDVYQITDNLRCAERKHQALINSFNANLFVNVNCILQRGVNDDVPIQLINLIKSFNKRAVIRFKNVGQLGRFSLTHSENHSMSDLITILSDATGVEYDVISSANMVEDHIEENSRLFKLPDSKIWIKVTDWSPFFGGIPDPNSTRRGRITQDFNIAPFFEHVSENENGY